MVGTGTGTELGRTELGPHDEGAQVFLPRLAAEHDLGFQVFQLPSVQMERDHMVTFSHRSGASFFLWGGLTGYSNCTGTSPTRTRLQSGTWAA